MSRLNTPLSIDTSPEASRPALNAVAKSLGFAPNLFRVVGNSPAALKGYLGIASALSGAALDARTQERIALAIAEVNDCGYCRAAHVYLGRQAAKLDAAEITANRNGASNDLKANAALRFAVQVVKSRGHVSDAELTGVRAAGYSDAEIIEIILAVALNTFTNYVNEVADTEIDFPVVPSLRVAA